MTFAEMHVKWSVILVDRLGPEILTMLERTSFASSAFTFECSNSSHSGCRDGAVVRALVSHQCGPGSISRSGDICGLSLLALYSAPRGFLRVLRFPLS